MAAIFRFHMPLAATSLLTLLAQPLTAAALARLPLPTETLATWPVIFSTMLVLRGWGLALQETAIAQASNRQAQQPLRDWTLIVAAGTSFAALLLAFTPLLNLYLRAVISLDPQLWSFVRVGMQVLLLLPGLTALTSWLRGLLVAAGTTGSVYRGMGVNLAVNGVLLLLGVALQLPGILVAAVALMVASGVEYVYLQRRYSAVAEARRASTAAEPAAAG
jgi:progressive ankylosis protein